MLVTCTEVNKAALKHILDNVFQLEADDPLGNMCTKKHLIKMFLINMFFNLEYDVFIFFLVTRPQMSQGTMSGSGNLLSFICH